MATMLSRLNAALVAEAVGTFLFFFVGAGAVVLTADASISPGLVGVALAHGLALAVLVSAFGAISGAHFNPAVTLAEALGGVLAWRDVPGYVLAQIAGAFAGVAVAHLMFGAPVFFASRHVRSGPAQLLGEVVATFGLLAVIHGCARHRAAAVPYAVAAYITAAYWLTSSTSFANPAVRLARAASDTFAGIRPADAPGFIAAQLVGAAAATGCFRWLLRPPRAASPR